MSEQAVITEKPGQSGLDLLEHLRATGTPTATLEEIQKFIEEEERTRRQKPDAAKVFVFLEDLHAQDLLTLGTVIKAGKFVFGDAYNKLPPGMTATDEVASLRIENERLKRELREAEAQLAARSRQLSDARDKIRIFEMERYKEPTSLPPVKTAERRHRERQEQLLKTQEPAAQEPALTGAK
jgi:hypothetical protein